MSKWTKEKCHIEALKYKTRINFKKKCGWAYEIARNNNWLDDICSHINKNSVWKWLNDICSHMKRFGNKLFRCVYVYEFSDNCVYVGLTYNLEKRNVSRKKQINDAVTKHIKNTNLQPLLKQLSEYVFVDVAATLENDLIEFYKNNGWKVLNKAIGGAIGSSERYWTKELCYEEALKFTSRSEFYYKNNKVYSAAQRYGWLDDICHHMKSKIHNWTINDCRNEALKYKSRSEFHVKNSACYTWAIRHGILDKVCLHMNCMIGSNQYKRKIK